MAKEQQEPDLHAALTLAVDVMDEYEQAHPERSKEIIGHITTLGAMLRLFSDNMEYMERRYRHERLKYQ